MLANQAAKQALTSLIKGIRSFVGAKGRLRDIFLIVTLLNEK